MIRIRPTRTLALLPLLVALLAGCSKGPSYGSANAVIAVVDSSLMDELEPVLRETFGREVVTTRAEPVFEVTFTTPGSIGEFEKWKRLLVVEPLADAVLVPELVGDERPPIVAEVEDAWARDQTIWVLAGASPEATAELVRQKADSLYEIVHGRYVEEQVARMWASGRDSALFRSLVDSLGFGIVLPRVYRAAAGSAPPDSRVWYNQDPRRIVSIHWLPRPDSLDADTLLAIRRAWGREVFPEDSIVGTLPGAPAADTAGQAADTTGPPAFAGPAIEAGRTTLAGSEAVRLRGVWRGTEGPNAGMFLTYGVACGDTLVVLDGNLFAPDREKYPYLIQLEHVFSTFHCASGSR